MRPLPVWDVPCPDETTRAFCDYLKVTFPPDDSPRLPVESLVADIGGNRIDDGSSDTASYRFPDCPGGMLRYTENKRFAAVSVSGQVVQLMRESAVWLDFLTYLGHGPHKVTRLDLAVDLPIAGSDYVPRLWEKYPSVVHLTRKAVGTSVHLGSSVVDGKVTGTFYAGDSRKTQKVTAAVYDKAHEALKNRGEYLPPTTRIEVRIKGDSVRIGQGVTLKDAVQCDPAFYHYASPALVQRPAHVPEWVPGRDTGWVSNWVLGDPLVRAQRAIDRNPEIDRLVAMVDPVPGGREFLIREFSRRVHAIPEQRSMDNA